jgi:DNA-binding NtrC family response regulator
MAHILVVDDENVVLDFLNRLFTFKGHTVYLTKTKEEAKVVAEAHDFQIAFIELRLYRQNDGAEVFRMLKQLRPKAVYIIMTGALTQDDILKYLFAEGAVRCFKKPFDIPKVLALVDEVLDPKQPKE